MLLFTSWGKNILIGLEKLELSFINDRFYQNGTNPEAVVPVHKTMIHFGLLRYKTYKPTGKKKPF